MIISGLILSLSADETLAAQAVATVTTRSEFMPGERNARWLPVAMEARDDAASRDLHDWLHALPGVDFVEVAYVNFDEDVAAGIPACRRAGASLPGGEDVAGGRDVEKNLNREDIEVSFRAAGSTPSPAGRDARRYNNQRGEP